MTFKEAKELSIMKWEWLSEHEKEAGVVNYYDANGAYICRNCGYTEEVFD